jgi:H/ACA ribonucleoprotein complex subunit 4
MSEYQNKEFLVKSEDLPVLDYGKYPGARSVSELTENGFLVLDKPAGMTSREVVDKIKEKLDLKKTGHAGTLDPNVTGVLVVTLENACKVISALQLLDKEYEGVMHLHDYVKEERLRSTLKKFTGKIKQIPPVRSAVARRERFREVYSFEILNIKERDIFFRVKCESGTYIRTLCHDIGQSLGVGAHMAQLRRTKTGPFKIEDAVAMEKITKADLGNILLPVEAAVEHLGHVIIKDSAVSNITNGAPLFTKGISKVQKGIKKENAVAIITLKGELVALGKSSMESEEMLRKRGVAVRTDRVVMKKGVYPKMK